MIPLPPILPWVASSVAVTLYFAMFAAAFHWIGGVHAGQSIGLGIMVGLIMPIPGALVWMYWRDWREDRRHDRRS